jgi:hypothetical protein
MTRSDKPLTRWDADVIIANLLDPWRHWHNDYEHAVARGNHTRADFALDHLLDFDRRIAIVRSLSEEEYREEDA